MGGLASYWKLATSMLPGRTSQRCPPSAAIATVGALMRELLTQSALPLAAALLGGRPSAGGRTWCRHEAGQLFTAKPVSQTPTVAPPAAAALFLGGGQRLRGAPLLPAKTMNTWNRAACFDAACLLGLIAMPRQPDCLANFASIEIGAPARKGYSGLADAWGIADAWRLAIGRRKLMLALMPAAPSGGATCGRPLHCRYCGRKQFPRRIACFAAGADHGAQPLLLPANRGVYEDRFCANIAGRPVVSCAAASVAIT